MKGEIKRQSYELIKELEAFGLNFKTMLELINNITDYDKKIIQEKISSEVLKAIPLTK
jgi:hypothetical protein